MKRLINNLSILKKFKGNTMWMLSANVTRAITQSVYIILLAKMLGVENFGLLYSMLAITSILFPFIGLGFGSILIKSFASAKENEYKSWGNALLLILISGLLVIVPVIVFCYFFLNISLKVVVLLAITELFFVKIFELACQAYQAIEKLKITSTLIIIQGLLKLTIILYFTLIASEHTLSNWVNLYSIMNIIIGVISLILLRIGLGKIVIDYKFIKFNLKEGFSFAVGISSKSLYTDIDKVMLTKIISPEVNGLYSLAYKIVTLAFIPIQSLLAATYTTFFKLGRQGIKEVISFGKRITMLTVSMGLVIFLITITLSSVVPDLIGEEYKETVNIIKFLAFIPLIQSIYYPLGDIITGLGYQSFRSKTQVLAMIINIILNLAFIPFLSWKGAVFATILSEIFILLMLFTYLILKQKTTNQRGIKNAV